MKIRLAYRELMGSPPMDPSLVLTIEHEGTIYNVAAPVDQRQIDNGLVALVPVNGRDRLPWSELVTGERVDGATKDPTVLALVRANVAASKDGTWKPGEVKA